MKKLQRLWVALLLLPAGAGSPGTETVPAEGGERAQGAVSAESVLYFPDYVDGGGWSVQLALNNVEPNRSAPVEVEVYDQQGRPVPRFLGSTDSFEIPVQGSRILRSAGAGNLRRGWIQVERQTASVHGLLTYRHAESGIEVGVRPVPLGDHFALFVEESSDIGTGLAVFNPDASEIEFQLRDEAGLDPLGRVLTQGNFQQRAHVLPEWFAEAGTRFLENFRGLLFLRAADGSGFAPMGLRGGKRIGSFSAVPAIPVLSDGAGKMYWTDSGTGKIQRANLDGTRVEDLVTGLGNPVGLELDPGAGKMYWTGSREGKIQRANLDGTGVEDLVTGLNQPVGVALGLGAGKMYWTHNLGGKIRRANLDGTGVEDVTPGAFLLPEGLALDAGAGKMYWIERGGVIQRANLDGTGFETVVTGLRGANDLVLVLVNGDPGT